MKRWLVGLGLLLSLGWASPVFADSQTLDIAPIYQEDPSMVWLAVGEMLLRDYFQLDAVDPDGDYQCGINKLFWGKNSSCWSDCKTCLGPSGTMSNFEQMIVQYPVALNLLRGKPAALALIYTSDDKPLTWSKLKDEIGNNQRPVVAGINPVSDSPRHVGVADRVVLIIGYSEESGEKWVIVNDPYPYALQKQEPYNDADNETVVVNHQYKIHYDKFINGLGWTYSGYGLNDPNQ